MFSGTTIDELIAAVERAERQVRTMPPSKTPVKVTRYEAAPGFVYAIQFSEPSSVIGVA